MAQIVFPATYREILSKEQLDYMMDWMYSSESLKNQMEKEHHIYYIAYEECEPAGYVSIQQEDTDLFHLQKIYVLPLLPEIQTRTATVPAGHKGYQGTSSGTLPHGTECEPAESCTWIL